MVWITKYVAVCDDDKHIPIESKLFDTKEDCIKWANRYWTDYSFYIKEKRVWIDNTIQTLLSTDED